MMSDKVNQMVTLTMITTSSAYCICMYYSDHSFDYFRVAKANQMVTLTVITISGAYCTVYGCIIQILQLIILVPLRLIK
jgi:hypothetical protein